MEHGVHYTGCGK